MSSVARFAEHNHATGTVDKPDLCPGSSPYAPGCGQRINSECYSHLGANRPDAHPKERSTCRTNSTRWHHLVIQRQSKPKLCTSIRLGTRGGPTVSTLVTRTMASKPSEPSRPQGAAMSNGITDACGARRRIVAAYLPARDCRLPKRKTIPTDALTFSCVRLRKARQQVLAIHADYSAAIQSEIQAGTGSHRKFIGALRNAQIIGAAVDRSDLHVAVRSDSGKSPVGKNGAVCDRLRIHGINRRLP